MSANLKIQKRSLNRMLLVILCFLNFGAYASICKDILSSSSRIHDDRQALEILGQSLSRIVPPVNDGKPEAGQMIEQMISSLKTASDLVIASFAGSANSGKSTLFNMLAQVVGGCQIAELSKAGLTAGLTCRLTVGVGEDDPGQAYERDRRERLGPLQQWQNSTDATRPGNGLVVQLPTLPEGIAIVDAPDINSGSRLSAEPTNLNSALHVINPSDILFIIVDKKDYANRDLRVGLNSIFKKYGVKHTILIFEGYDLDNRDQVAVMLKEFANEIYPETTHSLNGFPSPVLGAYLMPNDAEVRAGRAHPKLVPVGGGVLSIEETIRRISTNRKQIRQASIGFMKDAIVEATTVELKKVVQKRLAAQLYLRSIDEAIETSASSKLVDFPYDDFKEYIRNTFGDQKSDIQKVIKTWNKYVSLQFISSIQSPFSAEKPLPVLKTDHLVHDSFAVETLKLQLSDISNHHLTPGNQQEIDLYRKMFPDAQRGDQYALPSSELLSPEIRSTLRDLIQVDRKTWSDAISAKITQRQTIRKNGEIDNLLKTLANRSSLANLKLSGVGVLTALSPLAGVAGMSFIGVNAFLPWLIVLFGPPFLLKQLDKKMTDAYLRDALNDWYKQIQKAATLEYFLEVLSPLRSQLKAQSALHANDLESAEEALQFLTLARKTKPIFLR